MERNLHAFSQVPVCVPMQTEMLYDMYVYIEMYSSLGFFISIAIELLAMLAVLLFGPLHCFVFSLSYVLRRENGDSTVSAGTALYSTC